MDTRIVKGGYVVCNIFKYGNPDTKTYLVHRFVIMDLAQMV